MALSCKNYYLINKDEYEYRFKTKEGSQIHVAFILAGTTNLGFPVFSIVLDSEPAGGNASFDSKVGATISFLISDFLKEQTDCYLFFLCDDSDKRGQLRFDHFLRWFHLYNQENLVLTKPIKLNGLYCLISPKHLSLFADQVMEEIERL